MEQNKCNKCGRPMQYATEPKCNYCDACMSEYCGCKLGRIKEIEPTCDSTAIIPSITVESVEGITNLANCLVHVEDINTTFYVDDKHRIMITWAGPVDIPDYDMENNPNGYRDQIVTDIEKGIAVIYDKHGKGYTFGIYDSLDSDGAVTQAINDKLDEMAADGTLEDIIAEYIGEPIYGFDTIADMKASTTLRAGDRARTLGFHTVNDGGEALYKIRAVANDDVIDGMLIIEIGDSSNQLIAELILGDSVCPEMLGAYGDGTHDDTLAIAKTVTLNTKVVMSKNYLISSNIRIGDIDNLDIDGEKSTITYNGDSDDYAFLIQHLNGGNIKFGKIESNGGCIKFYSALGAADRVQYLKLKFNHLRASTTGNCIYAEVSGNGWVNEVQLDGGYFTRGAYGIYLTNLRTAEGGIGAWKFNNIGFEGTAKNIHLDAASGTYQRGHYFENIRYVENTTATLFETTGRIDRLTMVSWGGLEESRLNFEFSKLYDVKLVCPIYETGTTNIKANGIFYNNNRTRYIYDESTWSLPTKNTTNVSSGTIRFSREGNVCVIRIQDLVTLTNSGNLINVLPYIPVENTSNIISNSNGSKIMRVYADTSGQLKFSMPSADIGTSYSGELVFFTGTNIVSNA